MPNLAEHPETVKIRRFGVTSDGLKIWLVDGPIVRRDYDIEYAEGGHHLRYAWIPDKEVWIESCEGSEEELFILLHELHEYHHMVKGLSYEKAHEKASKIELKARKNPEQLRRLLRIEKYMNWRKANA